MPRALKPTVAASFRVQDQKMSKSKTAKRMPICRAQLDRLFDSVKGSVTPGPLTPADPAYGRLV
jgi:hypothetical protein